MSEYKHWKTLMENTYIGAWSLKPGEEKVLTIKEVKSELVTATGGSKELCAVAYFQERDVLPMVLNKTNCKIIEKLYGEDVSKWIGKKIQIFATTTRFGAETNIPCLRVRNNIPASNEVEYRCMVCGKLMSPDAYQKSIARFGKAYCSQGCYDKDTKGEDVLK